MNLLSLIDIETKSARIAAVLDQNPALAANWRQCAALTESCASLALEDLKVAERDLVDALIGQGASGDNVQSVRNAEGVYRALLSPGHLLSHPEMVFDRAIRACAIQTLAFGEPMSPPAAAIQEHQDDMEFARRAFTVAAPRILRSPGPILLVSCGVAELLRRLLPEPMPIAERLVFMAAESYLRQDLAFNDPFMMSLAEGKGRGATAYWTMLPSSALCADFFRAWSPSSPEGRSSLLTGLSRVLNREISRLGDIHRWREHTAAVLSQSRGRPRYKDLESLLTTTTILDASTVAQELNITGRTARSLLTAAANDEVLQEISGASSYRRWVTTPLHQAIKQRAAPKHVRPRTQERAKLEELRPPLKKPQKTQADFDKDLDEILSGIDDVLRKTTTVLDRFSIRQSGRSS